MRIGIEYTMKEVKEGKRVARDKSLARSSSAKLEFDITALPHPLTVNENKEEIAVGRGI